MATIALPWFVLVTTGSPARMGAVMAAEFVGMALLGIPSGRPAAALVGDDETRLTRVTGLLSSVNETASFAGPAIGGLLIALIGPSAALLIDAGTFLVAFGLVLLLVPPVPPSAMTEEDRSPLRGLRYIARDHPLLQRVIGVGIIEIGFTAMLATLPVLALRRYESGARLAGWFLASYGLGSVIGGLLSARAKETSDRAAALAVVGMAAATVPLLFDLPAWAVALSVAANGVCSGLFFPRFFAAITIRTPAELRPTVMTSTMTAISSTGPLGFLGAGLLLQNAESATAGFVLVVTAFAAGAAVVLGGAVARRPDSRPAPSKAF